MRGRMMSRGDTIIEVIFAMIVFAAVAVSSLAVMNRAIAAGERSLEITLVRLQMSSQAEALKYTHRLHEVSPLAGDDWSKFRGELSQSEASEYGVSGGECKTTASKPFFMNPKLGKIGPEIQGANLFSRDGPVFAQIVFGEEGNDTIATSSFGVWVEAVPSPVSSGGTRFIDFHIRACWPDPVNTKPITLGTIVRLYDPA